MRGVSVLYIGTSMLVWPCMFEVVYVHVGVVRWGGVFKFVGVIVV